jgi:hypothetical protein
MKIHSFLPPQSLKLFDLRWFRMFYVIEDCLVIYIVNNY